MPSHLTRQVFRRILANEPIVYRGCLRRQPNSTARLHHHGRLGLRTAGHGPQPGPWSQRRSFFNFSMFRKRQKESKDADIAPGIEDMMQYAKLERMSARLPPPEHVYNALKKFFQYKLQSNTHGLEDTQAELALQCLHYCTRCRVTRENADQPREDFELVTAHAATVLRWQNPVPVKIHADLATAFYREAQAANLSDRNVFHALSTSLKLLCRTGRFSEARDMVLEHEAATSSETTELGPGKNNPRAGVQTPAAHTLELWQAVLHGCALANDKIGVEYTLKLLQARGLAENFEAYMAMFVYRLHGHDASAVEDWYFKFKSAAEQRRAHPKLRWALRQVLQWCLSNEELELGHKIVRESLGNDPSKQIWDTVFVWAAGTGKGADEISRMLDVMEASNRSKADKKQWRLPDVDTINGLVEFAVTKNDPYMAERFIILGQARGIDPNASTYVLQMQYRLNVKDLDGALTAYKNLQAANPSSSEDGPTVNKLIIALCKSKRHDFDTIMNVAADLSDRQLRFEAETVSSLALLHLSRDELHDVIDLLNTHSFHFSSAKRESIRNSIVEYCKDQTTTTPRAWDAYCILRSIFDETPRPQRTQLMEEFFRRERPDMAVHVFNAMRAHSRSDTYPTTDTYVSAFLNAAKIKDLESLEVIHNQLKLDYNIDPTTYLRNALIIGYTGCGQPRRGLSQWDDIVASKEGPTYNSIHIALRACERSPFGDIKAKDIWAKLRRMKIDLDQSLWASYAGALVGNGDVGTAIDIIEQAEKDNEVEIDAFLLGSMYNGAPGETKRVDVEEWAKERYPGAWSELEKIGRDENEHGLRLFKLQRDVGP